MTEKPAVCFATLNWASHVNPIEPDGCAWYRCYLPMKELEKYDNWEIAMGVPDYHEDYGFGLYQFNNEVTYGWDVVIFKLIMLKSVLERMDHAKSLGQKIVVDIDDWFDGLSKTNLAYQTTDPEKNPENNREHYFNIIRNADALITSTPFLQDFYKNEYGLENVFLVRNGIDLPRWTPRRDHARWLPTIGWVGATPWRSNDLETMQPFFGEYMEKKKLTFHHAGHIEKIASSAQQLGLPNTVKFTHEPRKIISQYPEMFRKIDVGIVPLNNVPFNHAKSGIKGLEYTAAGIPFIAGYSPEYQMLADEGIGRVANTPEEWIQHLTELEDPKVRKEDWERNYENVKLLHSMEVRGQDWDNVIKTIITL